MYQTVQYLSQSSVGPTPAIWAPLEKYLAHPGQAIHLWEDFRGFDGTIAAMATAGYYRSNAGAYRSYEDTSCTVLPVATNRLGQVNLATDGTDNAEVWLQYGGAAGVHGLISDTTGDDLVLAFEARFKVGSIGNTYNAFVGLGEEGMAVADTITDAGAYVSKDFVGFGVLEADGDALSVVYRKAGQAAQTPIAIAKTLVADTFVKAGLLYDPSAPSAKRIKIFIDGVEQTTYITGTNIAAATFPDGEELAALFGVKNGGAAAHTLSLDWWRFFQLRAA